MASPIINTYIYETETYGVGSNYNPNSKSLAPNLIPQSEQGSPSTPAEINILNDYPWTLSKEKQRFDMPRIILKEYKIQEAALLRSAKAFVATSTEALEDAANAISQGKIFNGGRQDALEVYNELYAGAIFTRFRYTFPYFNEVNFELNTPAWDSPDAIGEFKNKALASFGKFGGFIKGVEDIASTALGFSYPMVGISDRPKIFQGHQGRTLTVDFPLYNTLSVPSIDNAKTKQAWVKNREFIFLFLNQNLYNKRDLVTGEPPVFYEVLVPGQFYSRACQVTNIKISNLGNMRTMYDGNITAVVPDAYKVQISLMDLLMPSKNLHQAADSQAAFNNIYTNSDFNPQ